MKINYLPQKGIMTLSLLIICSSVLFLLLLFDDDSLRLHAVLAAQRQKYVENSQFLQLQSHSRMQQSCQQLSLQESGSVRLIKVETANRGSTLQQFFYCSRSALFKQMPRNKSYEGEFDIYIDREKLSQFAPHFTVPQNGRQSAAAQLYWFSEANAVWEIEGDVNGVIVAQGNLSVSGPGKIRGTVISGGMLNLDRVILTYRKTAVAEIISRFSEWQLAEKSWYDFKPL